MISLNMNVSSLRAQRSLFNANNSMMNVTERLSSGVRINSAADDAANLELSKKLSVKNSGLEVATRNIQTGITKLQTFEGHIHTMFDSLHRIRNLATQAANGVYSESERNLINNDAQALIGEIQSSTKQANSELGVDGNAFIKKIDQLSESELQASYDEDHIIRSASELVSKISANTGDNFILAGNIDMSELGTLDKSAVDVTFSGNFDGNGYTVDNLKIDTQGAAIDNIGLFSESTGTIKNVAVKNANVSAGNSQNAGILVGRSTGIVDNSSSSGYISGNEDSGGLAGEANTITNSHSSANVDGTADCIGGLVGWSTTVDKSFATGDITSTGSYVGGLIGGSGTSITNSYATGNVKANGWIAGGLAGVNWGSTANTFATGDVYAGGNVAGGLLGNSGNVSNSYATGDVYAGDRSGGLLGITSGTVTESYATGVATGLTKIGALIGELGGGANVTNTNVWNTDTANGTAGAGNVNGQTFNAVGLTTKEILNSEGPISSWGSAWNIANEMPSLSGVPQQGFELNALSAGSLELQVSESSSTDGGLLIDNLGLTFGNSLNFDLSNTYDSGEIIANIDKAIGYLGERSAELGANMNRLELMVSKNQSRSNGLVRTNSTIRDTDMALESANLTKNQLIQQASVSMIQQAQNIHSSALLSLY